MTRTNYPSGAKWEDIVGYSRAVKAGNLVEVSGTVAVDEEGNTVGIGRPYEQTAFILKKIGQALERAGCSQENVIRTRIYVTDISNWPEVARAHAETYGDIRPASTLIEVSALVDPSFLVEIEATAHTP
jgi:enamine deaminase RidA (YjgF/YER057c/UK114 family)